MAVKNHILTVIPSLYDNWTIGSEGSADCLLVHIEIYWSGEERQDQCVAVLPRSVCDCRKRSDTLEITISY